MRTNPTLDHAIAEYAMRARAQSARPASGGLLGYAAAAGAGLAMTAGADAAIIYTNVDLTLFVNQPSVAGGNSWVSSYNYYDIDFNQDGTPEFSAMVFWSMLTNGGATSFNAIADVSRQFGITGGAVINGSNELALLASGTPINPPNQPSTGGRELKTRWQSSGGSVHDYGTWGQGVIGFAGFGFQIGGSQHYGWVRLSWDDLVGLDGAAGADGYVDQLTIHDLAWNDTPDGAIAAGDGIPAPAPAPAPLALLACGAVGLAALRRRRGMVARIRE
jgi:hypothetical protein